MAEANYKASLDLDEITEIRDLVRRRKEELETDLPKMAGDPELRDERAVLQAEYAVVERLDRRI